MKTHSIHFNTDKNVFYLLLISRLSKEGDCKELQITLKDTGLEKMDHTLQVKCKDSKAAPGFVPYKPKHNKVVS